MTDTCVCCGEYVPEGRQVCIACETDSSENRRNNKSNKLTIHCHTHECVKRNMDIEMCTVVISPALWWKNGICSELKRNRVWAYTWQELCQWYRKIHEVS